MPLQPGDMAPDFTLPSTVGDKVTLSDYRGKKSVVLLAVAEKYGVYLADKGISARTAFVIGKDGLIKEIIGADIPIARDIAGILAKARAA